MAFFPLQGRQATRSQQRLWLGDLRGPGQGRQSRLHRRAPRPRGGLAADSHEEERFLLEDAGGGSSHLDCCCSAGTSATEAQGGRGTGQPRPAGCQQRAGDAKGQYLEAAHARRAPHRTPHETIHRCRLPPGRQPAAPHLRQRQDCQGPAAPWGLPEAGFAAVRGVLSRR